MQDRQYSVQGFAHFSPLFRCVSSRKSGISGQGWGWYDGTLAVAALKAGEALFIKFDSKGKLVDVRIPPALKSYGRLRAITALPNGSLLITTDNGGDDAVLRVRPVV